MSAHNLENYLTPKDVAPEVAGRVLAVLNSSDSPDKIAEAVNIYVGDVVLSIGVVQKILNRRAKLGRLTDLHEVATVPRIGAKKFTAIIHALSELS